MLKSLIELKKNIILSGKDTDRIDYLIRLASVSKGIYKLENGMIVDYSPTAPATIKIRWSPDGSKFKKDQEVMQGEEGFSEIYNMIKSK